MLIILPQHLQNEPCGDSDSQNVDDKVGGEHDCDKAKMNLRATELDLELIHIPAIEAREECFLNISRCSGTECCHILESERLEMHIGS